MIRPRYFEFILWQNGSLVGNAYGVTYSEEKFKRLLKKHNYGIPAGDTRKPDHVDYIEKSWLKNLGIMLLPFDYNPKNVLVKNAKWRRLKIL